MIESQSHGSDTGGGPQGLDYEEVYQARNELNTMIKRIIEIVRKALLLGKRTKTKEVRSYTKPHRFLDGAPGCDRQTREVFHGEAVLVLDTSGSMWIPELLDQMAGLTTQLNKRGLIRKAYCCDVNLHPLDLSFKGGIKFKGSGGTVWSREHHTHILQDLKTSKKICIYYCTDGMVEGLSDAEMDERVTLVVINIQQMIEEKLYQKANL